jgi:hypothetical protein
MFNNYDHFKKSTKSLFEASKSQKLNLSQFRENFVKLLGFENLSALKSTFQHETILQSDSPELYHVVSVIFYCNNTIVWKKDFIDTPAGNKLAESLFSVTIKDLTDAKISEDDLESHIEDGYFETTYDDSKVFIVHSY